MTDFLIGAVIGFALGGAIIFLLPYRSLWSATTKLRTDLAEEQAKNSELQGQVITHQTTAYQTRQTMLAQQKRFEDDFTQASEQRLQLEQDCVELKGQIERAQQQHQQETERLRDLADRLEKDKAAVQKQLAQERFDSDQQIQSYALQSTETEEQIRSLKQDKQTLSAQFEEQQGIWEGERLELHVQLNTLEDSLSLYKMRADQNLSADGVKLAEQLRSEATVELNRRRAAWDEERQALQKELEQLRGSGATASAEGGSPAGWEAERQGLLQQLTQAQQSQRALEEKMAEQDRQAEQVRSALEEEIEQLMERFLRLHNNERSG